MDLVVPYTPPHTDDLLYSFLQQAGEFETPQNWLFWSGLSMIAAAVGDRVWFEHIRGLKLYPNLYVILVGRSGRGKGLAIRQSTQFLKHTPRVRMKEAKVTSKRLIDWLAEEWCQDDDGRIEMESPRLHLITSELSMSLDSDKLAGDFIKFMTAVYEGNLTQEEATRMWGDRKVPNPCLNWLGGSDFRWLRDSITTDDLLSGLGARTFFIESGEMPPRQYQPIYPRNYEMLQAFVRRRVRRLVDLHGAFTMTPEARELSENWYYGRPDPSNPQLEPFWNRERAHMQKLSMVLSMSESESKMIRRHHVAGAIRLITAVTPALLTLIRYTSVSAETRGIDEIRDFIQRAGNAGARYSMLAKQMSGLGMGRSRLSELLILLKQAGEIEKRDDRINTWHWRQPYRSLNDCEGAEEPNAETSAEADRVAG